ncbi:MAG: hypothetical protein A2107_07670 [Verrucomicrobia bacterium GWF2_62_7]|nr:MAG: hypothetical protein A2107_07670 [Verrucomicrobia bacterium GWF2_62_7]
MKKQKSNLIFDDDAGFVESASVFLQSHSFSPRGASGCVGSNTAADVITPAALNAAGIDAHLRLAAENAVPGEDQAARRALEMVRAYDPCISCSPYLIRRRRET